MAEAWNTDAWVNYQRLWAKLARVRWIHGGLESEEEDRILEEMDEVWWKLTDDERVRLQAEVPRSLIKPEEYGSGRVLVDVSEEEIASTPGGPLRIMVEAA